MFYLIAAAEFSLVCLGMRISLKGRRILVSIAIVLLLLGCGREPAQLASVTPPPSPTPAATPAPVAPVLLIAVLDIGQGDATLVRSPEGHTILIDGGPPGSAKDTLLPALRGLGIEQLDYMISTHYDADHLGGIPELIVGEDGLSFTADDFWPQTALFDHGTSESPETELYFDYASLTAWTRETLEAGDRLALPDGLTASCLVADGKIAAANGPTPLWPDESELPENAKSIGLLIEFGKFRYWTGGDLPGEAPFDAESSLGPLLAAKDSVDLLHLHHHGSAGSNSLSFLEALAPRAALISAGSGNDYGHPAPEVLGRLRALNIPAYATHTANDRSQTGLAVVGDSIWIEATSAGDFSVNGIPILTNEAKE